MLRTLTQACLALCTSLLMPAIGHATVYGADDRTRPEAMLDALEEQRYSATQVIVCRRGDGQPHIAAGNLTGDFTHGVTIAHLFHQAELRIDYIASECIFEVRDRLGNVLDGVAFKRLRTLWQTERRVAQNDLAMFELARRPKGVKQLLSLDMAPVRVGQEILLVTFHFDVKPYLSKRKTRGFVYSTLGATDSGMANIFNTDVDCVPMSSGGPVRDEQGRLVALIQGEARRGNAARKFDSRRDYNAAIRLDASFLRTFAEFVGSRR